MNCFYHQDRPAVGICKNCQRGLCPDCAAEVTDGLACKGKCESKVLLLGRLIEGNEKATETAKQAYRRTATAYIIVGVTMGALGGLLNFFVLQLEEIQRAMPALNYMSVPFWIMAAVMVLIGVSYWRAVR